MPLYDRPLSHIMAEEPLSELPTTFSSTEMIEWVQAKYPLFKDSTIRAHLRSMAANDPNKRHHNSPRRDVFFKIDRSHYRLYDADRDGLFDEMGRLLTGEEDESDDAGEAYDGPPEDMAFALELHLEEFMEANWQQIDFGASLELYKDSSGRSGRQFTTSVGTIDFLCQDPESGDFVVIELKKGRPSDKVLGQCQRYMGWVKKNLAGADKEVRGLIIAPEPDDRLAYALSVAPNIHLRCYKVDFALFTPPSEESA